MLVALGVVQEKQFRLPMGQTDMADHGSDNGMADQGHYDLS